MNQKHLIVATAGHVDHGKSSLVKALTGIDPDRLPEEKARGITIDLGFAHLDLQAVVQGQMQRFQLGLVDVPGHEDFVKNMVAGVGSIDLALFVVAADDGWMPQTEEHLQILAYLGVNRAIVALTKIDLVEDEPRAIAAVTLKLADSPFSEAPIIPTSTVTGRGLEELKHALALILADTPDPRDLGKPRLSVDRVFVLHGVGTVVTGTLIGGSLQRGQAVVIQPSARAARIRTIQSHNQQVEVSRPGTRTALNLPDIEASAGVHRGDVITLPELGTATNTWDVLLEKSGRPEIGKSTPTRPLQNGARVRLHIGSASVPVHVHLLEAKTLAAGGRELAQIRLDSPIFAFAGDRFILRDWAEQATLAGGIILNIEAQRRHARSEAKRKMLHARAQAPDQPRAFVDSQLALEGVRPGNNLLVQSRFSAPEIADAVRSLVAEKKAVVPGHLVANAAWWERLRQTAIAAIDSAHREHPEQIGFPLNDLRATLKPCLPFANAAEVFDTLVADLDGFAQEATTIRRVTHRAELPAPLRAAGAKVRSALSAKPLDPPSRKDLAPDPATQQALRFLLETGEAVALSEDIVLLTVHLTTAAALATKFLRQEGSATAGELRQALGTSRRVIIPLLEHLDKKGLTRRDGDKRTLKKTPPPPIS